MFERYRKSMVKSEAISNKIYTNLKAKKIHIPIFPDLYDDLNQSEINYKHIQFLFSGKKNKDFLK